MPTVFSVSSVFSVSALSKGARALSLTLACCLSPALCAAGSEPIEATRLRIVDIVPQPDARSTRIVLHNEADSEVNAYGIDVQIFAADGRTQSTARHSFDLTTGDWIGAGETVFIDLPSGFDSDPLTARSIEVGFAIFADHGIQGTPRSDAETVFEDRRARAIEGQIALEALDQVDPESIEEIARAIRDMSRAAAGLEPTTPRIRHRQTLAALAEQMLLDEHATGDEDRLAIAQDRLRFLRDEIERTLRRSIAGLPPEMAREVHHR